MPPGRGRRPQSRSPESARSSQLACRARAHVKVDRPRYEVPPGTGAAIARAFFEACRSGDASALAAMMAEEDQLHSDGGGKVLSYPNVIEGAGNLVRLFLGLQRKVGDQMEFLGAAVIDGLSSFASRVDGTLQVTALEIEDGRIAALYLTWNPDKLAGVLPH